MNSAYSVPKSSEITVRVFHRVSIYQYAQYSVKQKKLAIFTLNSLNNLDVATEKNAAEISLA